MNALNQSNPNSSLFVAVIDTEADYFDPSMPNPISDAQQSSRLPEGLLQHARAIREGGKLCLYFAREDFSELIGLLPSDAQVFLDPSALSRQENHLAA